eukprot:jgi/Hompol1/5481/HPOL_000920-RA
MNAAWNFGSRRAATAPSQHQPSRQLQSQPQQPTPPRSPTGRLPKHTQPAASTTTFVLLRVPKVRCEHVTKSGRESIAYGELQVVRVTLPGKDSDSPVYDVAFLVIGDGKVSHPLLANSSPQRIPDKDIYQFPIPGGEFLRFEFPDPEFTDVSATEVASLVASFEDALSLYTRFETRRKIRDAFVLVDDSGTVLALVGGASVKVEMVAPPTNSTPDDLFSSAAGGKLPVIMAVDGDASMLEFQEAPVEAADQIVPEEHEAYQVDEEPAEPAVDTAADAAADADDAEEPASPLTPIERESQLSWLESTDDDEHLARTLSINARRMSTAASRRSSQRVSLRAPPVAFFVQPTPEPAAIDTDPLTAQLRAHSLETITESDVPSTSASTSSKPAFRPPNRSSSLVAQRRVSQDQPHLPAAPHFTSSRPRNSSMLRNSFLPDLSELPPTPEQLAAIEKTPTPQQLAEMELAEAAALARSRNGWDNLDGWPARSAAGAHGFNRGNDRRNDRRNKRKSMVADKRHGLIFPSMLGGDASVDDWGWSAGWSTLLSFGDTLAAHLPDAVTNTAAAAVEHAGLATYSDGQWKLGATATAAADTANIISASASQYLYAASWLASDILWSPIYILRGMIGLVEGVLAIILPTLIDIVENRARHYGYDEQLDAARVYAERTWSDLSEAWGDGVLNPLELEAEQKRKVSLMYIDETGVAHPAVFRRPPPTHTS